MWVGLKIEGPVEPPESIVRGGVGGGERFGGVVEREREVESECGGRGVRIRI